ncbi:helix-turn-helix transcriptional regulator, partial [Pseudonocardia xishanensis]|uniref:helix-turn-helix domain-containing protein n=1 Tax=Pseudonocardia xishanensis TaxID=630995 RepID=UPI0031EE6B7E
MAMIDLRTEIKEFLTSRRARIGPERAGLPAYGGNRRVKGLRREEVALLAGVSVGYYVRMERGNLAGISDGVLDAVASALQLDEAERNHLFQLARQSKARGGPRRRRPAVTVRPALRRVLDSITDAPAWVCNGRYDVLAMNRLARALLAPVLADPRRPANTARFVYPNSGHATAFVVDHGRVARDVAAKLRREAGRSPSDDELIALVGELSTRSEPFRQRWVSQDVGPVQRSSLGPGHGRIVPVPALPLRGCCRTCTVSRRCPLLAVAAAEVVDAVGGWMSADRG